MILWTFPPHFTETEPAWEGAPLRSWRWALEVDRWSVRVEEQVLFADDKDWGGATRYVYVGVSARADRPATGMYHTYYDGPHHALWLGRLFLNWSLGWCDVCMPPEEDDTSGAVQDFVEELLATAMGGSHA